jgi:hypothetical protein
MDVTPGCATAPPPLSIEEGIALFKRGGGDLVHLAHLFQKVATGVATNKEEQVEEEETIKVETFREHLVHIQGTFGPCGRSIQGTLGSFREHLVHLAHLFQKVATGAAAKKEVVEEDGEDCQ